MAITSDGSASSNFGAWSRSSRQTMHCSACSAMLIKRADFVVAVNGMCKEHKVVLSKARLDVVVQVAKLGKFVHSSASG